MTFNLPQDGEPLQSPLLLENQRSSAFSLPEMYFLETLALYSKTGPRTRTGDHRVTGKCPRRGLVLG